MHTRLIRIAVLAGLSFAQFDARAEDIDLFAAPTSASAAPNMLLVIDNAANFSSNAAGQTCIIDGSATALSGSVGGIEQCALYSVINSLVVTGTASVNIGMMVYNAANVVDFQNHPCVGSNGGCLVYPLTGLTSSSKPALLAWIKSWKTIGGGGAGYIKASNEATGAALQEAWAYFSGRIGLSTRNYASLVPATACQKNFVVFIGNSYSSSGSPGDSTGEVGPKNALEGSNTTPLMNAAPAATAAQKAIISNTGANSTTSCGTVNFPSNHENSGFYADEWARYLFGQNIVTYTIGMLGEHCQASYAWLLNSMATAGGGKYFASGDFDSLKTSFETVLSEVQSVNSVFASVNLPLSVNTQGSYLNQVFVGMFRPDPDSLPRWAGNLKQYKLGYLNGVLKLLDADGTAAISSGGTDFIAECARSFWTPVPSSAGDGYWTALQTPNCIGYPPSSNSPDGNLVEKGGQGYLLRAATPASRIVKTCPVALASCTALTDFNASNEAISQSLLDSSNAVSREVLINWARGQNTRGESASLNGAPLTTSNMRPSAHGDVVHSRPVAVNFGTDAAPQVLVFYGGNDGVFRAINGNRTAAIGGVAAGAELWAFVPPEFYGHIKRLYDNTAKIGTPYITGGTPKNYGVDNPVAAYRDSNGDAWIFAGLRRGGRTLYAFKVDGSTLAITLKWKRGCAGSDCTHDAGNGDFSGIGQTWATAEVVKAAGYGGGASPMLAIGGGYDAACEDAPSYTCASETGRHVYLMDADTGVLLKAFDTDRGVVGDLKFVLDASGNASWGYVADLGGNVYRISGSTAHAPIGSTLPGAWTLTKIAALGCSTTTNCTSPPNRKFLYGPDVVVDGSTHLLLIGSGDREKPLNTSNPVSNYFFMIKDQPTVTTYLAEESGACSGAAVLCLDSLLAIALGHTPTDTELGAKKGWYLALNANEQVVTAAVTVYGVVYFSTHQPTVPSPDSCSSNLGTTRSYTIAYRNAANPDGSSDLPFLVFAGGGLPPSPVVGRARLDDGSVVPFIIGSLGRIEVTLINAPAALSNPAKIRSYWYIQK